MLFAESGGRRGVHITFFGGETLMNFPLLSGWWTTPADRLRRSAESIDFSLTTNATLLTPAIIEFLSENRIGVTVSMDGPPEMHDELRVFANGRGSYDIIAPKVRELLAAHRTRPIAARVTLTSQRDRRGADLSPPEARPGIPRGGIRAGDHFARSAVRDRRAAAWTACFEQFRVLAAEYLEYALRGELHGFSNVSDTLAELYQGVNKSHPCGAGLGLMGVGPPAISRPATALSIPIRTRWAISLRESIARSNRRFSIAATSTASTIAIPALRARCAPAAATTRRTCATATPVMPICTTATGYATGPTYACASTVRSHAQNPEFLENFAERKGL